MGRLFTATLSSPMLTIRPATVNTLGHSRVKPSLSFMPIDQQISNSPAMSSRTHAMTAPP